MMKWLWVFCLMGNLWAESIWVIDEEFVKFGKKEVYEEQKKGMVRRWNLKGNVIAIEDKDVPRFLYLCEMENYGEMDQWDKDWQTFWRGLNKEELVKFDSLINFKVKSAQVEVVNVGGDFFTMPSIRYLVVGIVPGNDWTFVKHIKGMIGKVETKGLGMKVWRIVMGGDMPKFVVCVNGKSEDELEEIDVLEGLPKDAIRGVKSGKAVVRRDLSYVR